MKTTIELPLLPLRDVVVYPHMVIPLFVGREKSIEALEAAMTGDKQILLLAQRNPADDDPGEDALYNVGTIATVLQLLKLPDGTVKVLVEGELTTHLIFGCVRTITNAAISGNLLSRTFIRLFFSRAAPILVSSSLPSVYGLMAAVEAKS